MINEEDSAISAVVKNNDYGSKHPPRHHWASPLERKSATDAEHWWDAFQHLRRKAPSHAQVATPHQQKDWGNARKMHGLSAGWGTCAPHSQGKSKICCRERPCAHFTDKYLTVFVTCSQPMTSFKSVCHLVETGDQVHQWLHYTHFTHSDHPTHLLT